MAQIENYFSQEQLNVAGLGTTGGNIVLAALINEFAQDTVTAAGTTQAGAFACTAQMIKITTAAAGSGILLPPSAPGLEVTVINKGANSVQVYGVGADKIDDQTNTVGVNQMAGSFVIYGCTTAGNWYTEGLANGFAGGLQTVSFQAAITATPAATQGQGPITKMLNVITTAASGSGVTLMASQAGAEITVINNGANSINVFPVTGETINALSVNAAFVQNNTTAAVTIFYCAAVGQWYTK